jgi:transcription elongation factor Elf1
MDIIKLLTAKLDKIFVCKKCNKRTIVHFEELITVATHCTCSGGPCDQYGVLDYLTSQEKAAFQAYEED